MPTLPTPSELRKALRYDIKTGKLYWRERPRTRGGRHDLSNKEVAPKKDKNGRARFSYMGRKFLAHRVIWCLHYGVWPIKFLDHINGDPSDNRIANLREVTNQENCLNQKRRKNNKSGTMGVYWDKRKSKWIACATVRGARTYLGAFDDKKEAVSVRMAAEQSGEYHENHGRPPAFHPDPA